MQPVQDLTVEDRISRTQYQYSIECADPNELHAWTPRLLEKLQTLPELRDVASDQQNGGLQASLVIDRDTASRLGVTPQMIDDTLYDAFGQRQVSTIFTQLNQYHVVLEVKPHFQQSPESLKDIYVRSATGAQVPLSTFTRFEPTTTALAVNHQGQFPSVTLSFNLAPGVALGDAVTAIEAAERRDRAARQYPRQLSGDGAGLPILARERAAADPGRAGHRLHRARRAVRELHPPADDSLDAALGRRRRDPGAAALPHRPERDRADRHHPVDRHREEERHHDDRLRARSRAQRRQAAGRGDLRGLPAALPADHDDDDGRIARRLAAGVRTAAPAPSCAGRWASRSSADCCSVSCSRCTRRRSSTSPSTGSPSGWHSGAAASPSLRAVPMEQR